MSRIVHLAALVGVAVALPAWAERPGSVQVAVFAGYDRKAVTNELGDAKDPAEVPQAAPGFGLRLGYTLPAHLTAEAEVKYVLAKLKASGDSAPILGVRAAARWDIGTFGRFTPFARVGAGSDLLLTSSTNVTKPHDADLSVQGGAGTQFALSEDLSVRLDALGVLVPGRNEETLLEFEGWLGLSYALGGTRVDTDGDGIADNSDKCPNVKETWNGYMDEDGCPEKADTDSDNDGIADVTDKCPHQAETKNGILDADGCPDTADGDGDGIVDAIDKCPNQPETKNGFQDDDGCPDEADGDGDGIVDSKDKCPKQAETKNGLLDDDGCPDSWPDADGDGVADKDDKCVKEPETKNGFEDSDGCPDKVPEKLKKFSGAISGIEFETGSAQILASSLKQLDQAVTVLKEFKDTRVAISGHTDDRGDPVVNKKLSLDRAEAVKNYLISKGIAGERIDTAGFGSEKPVASNNSESGRAKNRRIEFKLQ